MKPILRNRSPRLALQAFLALAMVSCVMVSCGGGSSGPPPSSLTAPVPGFIYGNWALDAGTIKIIADTGPKHDLENGDLFRISSEVEVIAGGVSDKTNHIVRLVQTIGGSYEPIANSVTSTTFTYKLVLDLSGYTGELKRNDFTSLTCNGTVTGSELKVYYLWQRFALTNDEPKEVDRDELEFICRPGTAAIPADVSGRWTITDVIEEFKAGSPPELAKGEDLVAAGGAVTDLFAYSPFTDQDLRAHLKLPPSIQTITFDSFAGDGSAQGFAFYVGRVGTPSESIACVVSFDFLRNAGKLEGAYLFIFVDDLDVDRIEYFIEMSPAAAALTAPDPRGGKGMRKFEQVIQDLIRRN